MIIIIFLPHFFPISEIICNFHRSPTGSILKHPCQGINKDSIMNSRDSDEWKMISHSFLDNDAIFTNIKNSAAIQFQFNSIQGFVIDLTTTSNALLKQRITEEAVTSCFCFGSYKKEQHINNCNRPTAGRYN